MGKSGRARSHASRWWKLSSSSFGLTVQRLPIGQRVLVLAELVGTRNGDGWFSTAEISEMLEALHLPQPKNLSATISNFRKSDLVLSRGGEKPWSLTPIGRERARELIENFSYEQISV